MYKLLYIDEDQEQIENFLNYIDDTNSNGIFSVITRLPLGDKEEMLEEIFKINPDVIVSDFLLNENIGNLGYNVPYDGVELMEDFLSIRDRFPCFVLTAKDKDAINGSEDVNLVYTKSLINSEIEDTKAKVKFADRLLKQIEHYKNRIENYKNELAELIEMRKNGEVDISIESRIIELDGLLEKSIDGRSVIPSEFKTLSNSNKLDNMLSKVDQLLQKLNEDGE